MFSLGCKMGYSPSASPQREAMLNQGFNSGSQTLHLNAIYLELSYNADSDSVDGGCSLGICNSNKFPGKTDVTGGWGSEL